MRSALLIFVSGMICFAGCTREPDNPVTIAINPWPGYEALYLAESKGFFDSLDLNLRLVQLGSLSEVQQAYTNRHVDGMASTAVEAVQVNFLGGLPNQIVLIPDYSNGGDMIIAAKNIESVTDLQGKRIGAELSSLGIYVLQRALKTHQMTLQDVQLINLEPGEGLQALNNQEVDAFVTYPPFSVKILENDHYHAIFSSADIPREIIDVVSIATPVLKKHPDLTSKLRKAWQMALEQMKTSPEESYQIMANHEGISKEEFKATLNDLILLDMEAQQALFAEPESLQQTMVEVCETLVHVRAITGDCRHLPPLIYQDP
ncbi:MAG: ABC transporter substrate-binding protein [Ketobacteraceae bacterium]|nr:ABC transporter substrate-binding protein [Ketobacteraceae bacterium]